LSAWALAASIPTSDTTVVPGEADKIIALYERHARAWARARGSALIERVWLDHFLDCVRPQGHVLDLGCGSGEPVGKFISEKGFAITGIDSSRTMIALFSQRVAGARALLADMRRLDLGEQFDGILAWDSFFHLAHEDQRSMFARFRSHSKEGAPLMFTSGREFGEAIGDFEGEPLYHASLSPSEYRSLLEAHGFTLIDVVFEDARCGGRSVWLARRS
jgi:SAM-dependent methyltransferase